MQAEFSGAGKGEYEVCASKGLKHGSAGKGEYEVYANNERNMGARGRESMKCVLKKMQIAMW